VAPDAFCWKICFCCVKNIPAPRPPISTKIPSIVAIIFPVPNFFFGDEVISEKLGAGGVVEPELLVVVVELTFSLFKLWNSGGSGSRSTCEEKCIVGFSNGCFTGLF